MKNVLVTGSTRGIGKEIANKFKQNGYYVIGTGTKEHSANSSMAEYFQVDFSQASQIENFCKIISTKNIDVLINNAGINIINNFCDVTSSEFLKLQQVNVYAPFRLSQSVLDYMIKSNWGRIVNISSVWGKITKKGRSNYSMSKFALNGMTSSISTEFAESGVLCNSVSPGFIDTEMTWNNLKEDGVKQILKDVPMKRLAKVDEVANLVYTLGSEQNTYISGQNIVIDGGFICG